MRTRQQQNAFTSGVFSPRLRGRTDLAKYSAALRECVNMIVQPQGGAITRGGTRHVALAKHPDRRARLVEFRFSIEQTYMLEFGDEYIRFFRDRGPLEEAAGTPTEIASPYAETDLAELSFAQSNDILFITHPDHAPRELRRVSANDHLPASWQLVLFNFLNGPYGLVNTTSTTLTPSATSGGAITITASSAVFAATDVGRFVRISNPASGVTWGYARITAFSSATSVTAAVQQVFATTNASAVWQLGAWSATTGYPRAVSFHQERLYFCATRANPQTVWGSRIGNFNAFGPNDVAGTVADDNAVTFTASDDQVNAGLALISEGRGLFMLTGDGPFLLRGGSGEESPITPTSFSFKRQDERAAIEAGSRPHRLGTVIVMIGATGRRLRELVYRLEWDRYVAPDLSILADHLTVGGIRESALVKEPHAQLWAVRGDGAMLCLTYDRDHDVVAWTVHEFAGAVESVGAIRDGAADLVWLIVRREIGGETVRHIEFIEPTFNDGDGAAAAFGVDAGLSYAGSPVSAVSGLEHLEGETVAILADGAVHARKVVTGGAVPLDQPASTVHVGLPRPWRLTTMPIAIEAPATMAANRRRLVRMVLMLHRSGAMQYRVNGGDLNDLEFREFDDPMDTAVGLFTGNVELTLPGDSGLETEITIEGDGPLPINVLAITSELEAHDV